MKTLEEKEIDLKRADKRVVEAKAELEEAKAELYDTLDAIVVVTNEKATAPIVHAKAMALATAFPTVHKE